MSVALENSICPDCSGSGWCEPVEGKGVRRCQCFESEQINKALASARIPPRFSSASFASYEASSPSLQRALAQSRRFVESFLSDGLGLLYVGNPGVGKTHLAVSVLRSLINSGRTGLFYDFRDLLKEIQDSYSPEKQSSELDVLRPILQAEILVLDELGAARPTEWVETTATHILSRRYNERRVTIFTTNYLDVGKAAVGESLTDRIGPRVRSRLQEMTSLILIDAPDYRETLRMRRSRRAK